MRQVVEGYGQTEANAVITCSLPGELKHGHVGAPVASTMVKLVDVTEMGYLAAEDKGEVRYGIGSPDFSILDLEMFYKESQGRRLPHMISLWGGSVLFCFVLFCLVLFCLVLFCFCFSFCFVLSCFVLSCFVLFLFLVLVLFFGLLAQRSSHICWCK